MHTPFDAVALAVREAVSRLSEERPDLPTVFSTSPGVLEGDTSEWEGDWEAPRAAARAVRLVDDMPASATAA